MQTHIKSISIPEPCHEGWDQMTPMHDGKFCQSCTRIVVDFSRMTDREIMNYLKNYKGKCCGNFRTDQLNRDLHPAPAQLPLPLRNAAATLLVSALATNIASAQSSETRIDHSTERLELSPHTQATKKEIGKRTISGSVVERERANRSLVSMSFQLFSGSVPSLILMESFP